MKKKTTQSLFLKAKSYKLKAAFTLVEMIVAFGIFSIIMVISVGSLLSLMQANYKAQTLKSVVNNLHFALENMSRNLRMGSTYHCGAGGDIEEPLDCANSSDSAVAFRSREGTLVMYRLNPALHTIERSLDGGAVFVPITAPEIRVEQLQFFVDGSGAKDKRQPRVLMAASGFMQGKGKVISEFNIQTLVSQRRLDI